jgi:hypothetical protein
MAEATSPEEAFRTLLRELKYGCARLSPLFQGDEDHVDIRVPREFAVELAKLQAWRTSVEYRELNGEDVSKEAEELRTAAADLLASLCLRGADQLIDDEDDDENATPTED